MQLGGSWDKCIGTLLRGPLTGKLYLLLWRFPRIELGCQKKST